MVDGHAMEKCLVAGADQAACTVVSTRLFFSAEVILEEYRPVFPTRFPQ